MKGNDVQLAPVAMFRELYAGERDELPSIYDALTSALEPDRPEILDYMRKSARGLDVMESLPDLFEPGAYIEGAPSLHTDGTWIWRTDSLRYLIREPLALPVEFVEFVRAAGYEPTPIERSPELSAAVRAWW
ncbi:hypothetical protein ACFWPK_23490 [Nocardia sp. NPDC058519]|uniref:hypothetical protein n=1 Tax=unclassified Nocardia TaxID=2637762 RepID=UPI003652CD10